MMNISDNPHLHKTEAMRCFTFYKSDEYPSGAIKISKEDAFKLQEIGWTVNFHTEYYLNFIGCNFNGLEIGFCNWMSNLDASISTPEVGYYSDCWGENVKFKSQDCLDVFVDTISNLVWLSKNNAYNVWCYTKEATISTKVDAEYKCLFNHKCFCGVPNRLFCIARVISWFKNSFFLGGVRWVN